MIPNSHEACLVVDKETGLITAASPWLSEMLGFGPDELIGQHYATMQSATRFAAGRVPWDAFQEFGYVAVHDLKSPMRRVSTMAGMLKSALGDKLEGQALVLVEQLMQASSQATELIKQLQAFTEALGPPVSRQVVELTAALRAATRRLKNEIESAKAEVVAGKLPAVAGDVSMIQVVFENLLSNSIRFRSEDPLKIEITANRAGDFWHVSVADNGIGIGTTGTEHLFQPFRRMHGSNQSGPGLGLAICQRIVNRSGGDIWLDKQRERGTSIVFALPVVQ